MLGGLAVACSVAGRAGHLPNTDKFAILKAEEIEKLESEAPWLVEDLRFACILSRVVIQCLTLADISDSQGVTHEQPDSSE